VAPGTRIEDDGDLGVGRVVQPADHLGLVVGLADVDRDAELVGERTDGVLELGVGGGSVDRRLAAPQPAEVHPGQHPDRGRRRAGGGGDEPDAHGLSSE
jgi:hypothetical protein